MLAVAIAATRHSHTQQSIRSIAFPLVIKQSCHTAGAFFPLFPRPLLPAPPTIFLPPVTAASIVFSKRKRGGREGEKRSFAAEITDGASVDSAFPPPLRSVNIAAAAAAAATFWSRRRLFFSLPAAVAAVSETRALCVERRRVAEERRRSALSGLSAAAAAPSSLLAVDGIQKSKETLFMSVGK